MTADYQEAGDLTAQAVRAKYANGDGRFYALMGQADEASAAGDAIATELGAESLRHRPRRAVRHGRRDWPLSGGATGRRSSAERGTKRS